MGIVNRLFFVLIGAALISFATHFTLSLTHNHRFEKRMHMTNYYNGHHVHHDRLIRKSSLAARKHQLDLDAYDSEDRSTETGRLHHARNSTRISRRSAPAPTEVEPEDEWEQTTVHKFTSPFLPDDFKDKFLETKLVKKGSGTGTVAKPVSKRSSSEQSETPAVVKAPRKVRAPPPGEEPSWEDAEESLPGEAEVIMDTETVEEPQAQAEPEEVEVIDLEAKPKRHKKNTKKDAAESDYVSPPIPELKNLDKRSCPPIFQEPACKDLSKSFHKDFPEFGTAFTKSMTLSVNSIKGYRQLTTGVPSAKENGTAKIVNLGPVTENLLKLLPKSEPAWEVVRTCAVIGSSGHLLKFNKGPEIDAHDLVLRFNSAPTKGFEKFVGAKTTHRLTNTRNFGYREMKSEHVYVHLRNGGAMQRLVKKRMKDPAGRLYSLHPAWHRFMDKTFGYLTTSGLNGIVMALHFCKHVDLYGFHVHPQMGALYHYYNPNDVAANEQRDDGEWNMVRRLVEGGYVHFAEPCIVECHDGKAACDACIEAANANGEET